MIFIIAGDDQTINHIINNLKERKKNKYEISKESNAEKKIIGINIFKKKKKKKKKKKLES